MDGVPVLVTTAETSANGTLGKGRWPPADRMGDCPQACNHMDIYTGTHPE